AGGTRYVGKAMVISTGGSPVMLNVPGEKEFTGKGVSYCAICDGAFFKGQIIAVIGGGDAAVEEAMFLTKFGSKVIVIHRRDQLRAQKVIQKRAFANPKMEFIWDTVVEKVNGDTKVRSLSLKNVKTGATSTLDVGAVFVFIGFHPNIAMLPKEIAVSDRGYLITDHRMETSIPGIFACGDVRDQLVRQITNAVGDGTTAAMAAVYRIEKIEG
ncbi:MAG: FAD-dependent oxidoreductase, partial [candidate division Zixibacteria bacterium]|nr:FAD-dependent oxidoreductase [candidate division Zixibacteria bacterium]